MINAAKKTRLRQTPPGTLKKALSAAFPYTIPIFAGFWFLGITYGIFMNVSGFSFWYPLLMSLTIFAGSVEFVTVNLLLGAFNPLQAFAMTVMINARHLFYGISMLEKFKGTGLKKPYLIFGMCDESFSINYTAKIPKDVDQGWFMFFVTLLNHIYWVSGAALGGIFGSLIRFNTDGLEFVMTAMFVVIFTDHWLKEKNHISSLLGLGLSLVCLAAFGADDFLIPSMLAIAAALTILRKPLETGAGGKESGESKALAPESGQKTGCQQTKTGCHQITGSPPQAIERKTGCQQTLNSPPQAAERKDGETTCQ